MEFYKKFTNIISSKVILFILRCILGGLFIYAALSKIISPEQFATDIANYRILPYWSVNIFAITLPWIEIISGICVIIGLGTRGAALIINGLLLVFMIAILSAIYRDININCGCFGKGNEILGWETFLRDLILFILGSIIIIYKK